MKGRKSLWRAADSQLYHIISKTLTVHQKVYIEEASFQGRKAGREAFTRLIHVAMGSDKYEMKQMALEEFNKWRFDGKIAQRAGRPRTLHQAVSHLRHVANLCTDLAGVKITDEELMLKLRSQLPERLRGAIKWIRMTEDEDAPTILFNDLVKKIERWAVVHKEQVDKAIADRIAYFRKRPGQRSTCGSRRATSQRANAETKARRTPENKKELTCRNCQGKGHFASACTLAPKCLKCGKTGHRTDECTSDIELRACRICGQKGHIASGCPRKRQQNGKPDQLFSVVALGRDAGTGLQ